MEYYLPHGAGVSLDSIQLIVARFLTFVFLHDLLYSSRNVRVVKICVYRACIVRVTCVSYACVHRVILVTCIVYRIVSPIVHIVYIVCIVYIVSCTSCTTCITCETCMVQYKYTKHDSERLIVHRIVWIVHVQYKNTTHFFRHEGVHVGGSINNPNYRKVWDDTRTF